MTHLDGASAYPMLVALFGQYGHVFLEISWILHRSLRQEGTAGASSVNQHLPGSNFLIVVEAFFRSRLRYLSFGT
jgi:hypothetical protein